MNLITREIFGGKSRITYIGNSSVASQQNLGLSLNLDGTKFYTTIHNGDYINQYSMSTPYDLSTSTFVSRTLFINQGGETSSRGHFISSDGLKLYVCGASTIKILQFILSTAWDVSTASYVSQFTPSASPDDISFSPNGIYMILKEGNFTKKYILSVAWDVTTAALSQTMSPSQTFNRFFFNPDGKSFFVINGSIISKYYLSVPWDLNTYLFTESIDIASLGFTFSGFDDITFSNNGLFIFISLYASANVKRLELSKPFSIKGVLT